MAALQGSRLLLAATLSCWLGPELGRAREHAGAEPWEGLANRSAAPLRGLRVELRDASAPFKASGTAHESWYRCADYCPLRPGQKNIVEFRCMNGACISIGLHCNGFPNCADGSDEDNCPQTIPNPYNCSKDADNWGKAWSVDKKAWCCQHKKIGCLPKNARPHNCQSDRDRWKEAWSDDKKEWCCALLGLGCVKATTSTSTATATTATATTATHSSTTPTSTSTTSTSTTSLTATTLTTTTTHTTTLTTRTATTATLTTVTVTVSTVTVTGTATTTSRTSTTITTVTSTATTTTGTTTGTTTSMTSTTSSTSLTSTTDTTTTVTTTSATTTTTRTTTTRTSTTFTTTSTTRTSTTMTTTRTSTTSSTSTTRTSTTTSTTVAPLELTMSCAEEATNYNPLDMFGSMPTQVGNVAECQARCAAAHGCEHYSYWAPQRLCHLQDSHALRSSIASPDFTAGPPSCLPAETGQRLLANGQVQRPFSFGPAKALMPLQKKFLHEPWREVQEGLHLAAGRMGLGISPVVLTIFSALALLAMSVSSVLLLHRWRGQEARPERSQSLLGADSDSDESGLERGGANDYVLVDNASQIG